MVTRRTRNLNVMYRILNALACMMYYRCGVLQEGDRVLAINGLYLDGRTMDEVNALIRESAVKMLLLVEFDVAGLTL